MLADLICVAGGQGMCLYLCDPTVTDWDRRFDGTGILGFVGKCGAVIGVGIDCTGMFCDSPASFAALKRASDGALLCDPNVLEGGVATGSDELWRTVNIRFDIRASTCDVTIGDIKVLDNVKHSGVQIPEVVCVGVCAGTAYGKTNHICIDHFS